MAKNTVSLEHVSDAMRAFTSGSNRKYRLSDHHRQLLAVACQAHSRMEQAQATVAKDGLTTVDRHGTARPHPAIQIEIQCRTGFIRAGTADYRNGPIIPGPADIPPITPGGAAAKTVRSGRTSACVETGAS